MLQALRPFQSSDVTAGATATASAAAPAGTTAVRLIAEANVRFAIGTVANATSTRLVAESPEYFVCYPGEIVSLIRENTTDVKVNVAFMTR